ncbi:hypothetical protein BDN67DRAFT_365952 [Paxillus ammoniavirescens]|nr:hypothetical protein BDN67DRAFT_365952 [Paxillus ammoniavirescens]
MSQLEGAQRTLRILHGTNSEIEDTQIYLRDSRKYMECPRRHDPRNLCSRLLLRATGQFGDVLIKTNGAGSPVTGRCNLLMMRRLLLFRQDHPRILDHSARRSSSDDEDSGSGGSRHRKKRK